jgi:rubrerythrin
VSESAYTAAPTRRELLGLALTSAFGAGAALGAATAGGAVQTDEQIVSALLESEQLAAFAYEHVLRGDLLSGHTHAVVHPILSQERAHVRAVGGALRRLGGSLPRDTANVTNVDKLLAASRQPGSLAQLQTEHDAILLLIRLEFALEGFYYAAISKLQDARVAGTLARVMGNEAQHACVLSELIRPGNVNKAVPSAFVQG